MGEVIDFQKAKEYLKNRKNTAPLKNEEVSLNILENIDGLQINLDTIRYLILNKSTLRLFIWFNEPAYSAKGLVETSYDVSIPYDTLEEAENSFYEINSAVKEYRND